MAGLVNVVLVVQTEMGYFTYIADQAFKKGEQGETLFYLGGPWSRPLIIREDQRDETYRRHLWMQRIFLGTIIVGQPFLFQAIPEITSLIVGFLIYFVSIFLLYWIAQRIVFRRELRECPRLDRRMPLSRFYQQMADRHSFNGLLLGLLGSVVFVAIGIWLLFCASDAQRFFGLIICLFFGAAGSAWAYALRLKSQVKTESEQDGVDIPDSNHGGNSNLESER